MNPALNRPSGQAPHPSKTSSGPRRTRTSARPTASSLRGLNLESPVWCTRQDLNLQQRDPKSLKTLNYIGFFIDFQGKVKPAVPCGSLLPESCGVTVA